MASFTVQLTPSLVTKVSEGSLDTTVTDGVSAQRTLEDVLVVNGSDRKILYRLKDGSSYDNTTFEVGSTNVSIGNPFFNEGTPVISEDNITVGHPTARSDSGSTL